MTMVDEFGWIWMIAIDHAYSDGYEGGEKFGFLIDDSEIWWMDLWIDTRWSKISY